MSLNLHRSLASGLVKLHGVSRIFSSCLPSAPTLVTSPEKKVGDYAQSRGFMQSLWNAIQGRTDCGHLSFTSLHRWGNKSLDAVMRILSSRLNVIDKTLSKFMILPRGNNGLYDSNFSCTIQVFCYSFLSKIE